MSGWHVWNNSFVNVTTGTFVGGGRLNRFHDNYYQNVATACHHFDARGLHKNDTSWNCTSGPGGAACIPGSNTVPSNCGCSAGALAYELTGPAGPRWKQLYPALAASLTDRGCFGPGGYVPCGNAVVNNTYCNVKAFADVSAGGFKGWNSVLRNNKEVPCRY